MRITIVGCGSRGSKLAIAADEMPDVKRIYLYDADKERATKLAESLKKAILVDNVEEELYHCDLVIECASQEAAHDIIPKVVARGVDILLMSVGALVDDDYREMVINKARECDSKIYIPSGAICGTDALRSSSIGKLDEVELITTMGPASFACVKYVQDQGVDVDTVSQKTMLFKGPAREAVKLFPRNVNVAAIVSILGIGFDKTVVTIYLDPTSKSNSHELRIKGEFGEMDCRTQNVPAPDNPRTSNLAVFSAISALERIVHNEWFGI